MKKEVIVMNKEEYYKRIEKINNRFRTDRVSADEEYQLVCQKNYLSTKYIEHLEQQCKKQKEVIDKTTDIINDYLKEDYSIYTENEIEVDLIVKLKNILKEASK